MCGFLGYIGNNPMGQITDTMLDGIIGRGEVTERFSNNSIDTVVRRLKIVDRDNAKQPMISSDGNYCLIFNGEIFNYKEIKSKYLTDYKFKTGSDTEVLLALLIKHREKALKYLNGQFAFVFFDLKKKCFFAGRDHIGISPIYYTASDNGIYFSSTIKGLTPLNTKIYDLKPGSYMTSFTNIKNYYKPMQHIIKYNEHEIVAILKNELTESVKRRVDSDLPIGVIYSGGIDSSIVLHLATKFHKNITAFTIGIEGSEDFEISKKFCKERGIKQVIVPFKKSDVSNSSIKKAIEATELTEYLDIINGVLTITLFKEIHKHGLKITLSGDGSDELFGGYDMYDKIDKNNAKALFEYKLNQLHRTELQRVDRAAGQFMIENRVPFLDIEVINIALKMEEHWKIRNKTEKWCVRKAFEEELPNYILYRKKNPLSHSSGLHEVVRLKKMYFKSFYNNFNYALHDRIRRDFSITLNLNNYNIDRATREEEIYKDYSLVHKIGEFIKGFIRFYIFSPNNRKRSKCINGNV